MTKHFSPYDADLPLFATCSCGKHASEEEHLKASAHAHADDRRISEEEYSNDFIEAALVKAILPQETQRRDFLRAVGKGAAMAAISTIFPLGSLRAMALEKGPIEKSTVKVGFIPITCAAPLILAEPMGFFKEQGLNVELNKAAGWALVRDKIMNQEFDASQFLAPMPLAMTMGAGSSPQAVNVAAIQNVNGQAIVLAAKHKSNRDPKNWKGFKFAIPFEFSMHNFLLRYYLAEAGIDPDRDVQLRVVPPAEMLANLRAGNIDGFLGPDPFSQRAVYDGVGFIQILSQDIWNGHPCCTFGASASFIQQNPNTFAALYRAFLKSSAFANDKNNRKEVATVISKPAYLNQPEVIVNQVITGRFADGLGNIVNAPQRVGFEAVPWEGMALWMLTQMKRWGYIKGDVSYRAIAEKVFMMTDAKKAMKDLGLAVPETNRKIVVMGKVFDSQQPQAYVDSFNIKR
ncbi:CmpA/NrtA family ABC transporter substrate-binding protein [Methylobacillus sp. Pita1]|uniref:CmpA/NrtA family ABC transporter substrate-binding protein n=1 Tax=Methylobacillus sp. Pita1 TaxID=3382642 RepID=UPI0038B4348E